MLSDDQIKELLKWFLSSSLTREDWIEKRKECIKKNHQWIDPDVIIKMDDDVLEHHYFDYFNSGTGEKQSLNHMNKYKIIKDVAKFRQTILYLLDEKIDIKNRINNVLEGDKKILGMGKALTTAFLMDFKPENYCLWNGKTEDGFKSLGWGGLYHNWGDSSGNTYSKVMGLINKLKSFVEEIDPELELVYSDVDLFLHTIAATEEGINELKKIKSNYVPKKWLFTVDMKETPNFKELYETTWSSAKEVEKGDIILFYSSDPYSSIGEIFIAENNPYEDKSIKEKWNKPAVDLSKEITLKTPIEYNELRNNNILKNWAATKMNFLKPHFKISNNEWNELKRLILERNPDLNVDISDLENIDVDFPTSSQQKIWKIAPGSYDKRRKMWPVFEERGYIGVGWFMCEQLKKKHYSAFKSLDQVKDYLRDCSNKVVVGTSARMIWNFGNVIRPGDIVVANNGTKGICGIGLIDSEYIGPTEANKLNLDKDKEYYHYRKVKWMITDKIKMDTAFFFDQKTITQLSSSKWEEIKSVYLHKDHSYSSIFKAIESHVENPLSIKMILNDILENYQDAKQKYVPINEQERVKDLLSVELPDYLEELPLKQLNIFSSAWGKWHYCPYVAIMNPEVSIKHTNGFFINYMFREDMSGVYLSLRQGIDDITMGDEYKNRLKSKALEYRKIKIPQITSKFSDVTDLKAVNASYAPFYEAGTIYSKFYEKGNLPSEEELEKDLDDMLALYDVLAENAFLKLLKEIYTPEIKIALGELERGKNVIFYGPPGSGKTVLSKIISEEYLEKDGYSLYTVHSGTDYYDLVCRIVPQIDEQGNLVYLKEKRFLLDALLSGKVLILDEINRTQIDTALGIFFTYLERDHRINDVEQIRTILKNEIEEDLDFNDLKQKLNDFRIIGTLNVYDKTFLFKLGDALKRRFTFIEITTKPELLNELANPKFKEEFLRICDYEGNQTVSDLIINVFADLNRIKPLGIGILKEALQFSQYFPDNEAADTSVSSLIVPFFENDLNYSTIRSILEKYSLSNSMRKLESLNFGTSDINGI